MPSQVIALIYVLLMAGSSAGIAYLLVINDFFLPKFLRARTVRGSQILSAAWVLAVAATVFEAVSAGLRWLTKPRTPSGLPTGDHLGFSPLQLWDSMGNLARAVVILLAIMSIWSLAVIIDRALYFAAARKQYREFAPKVAGALKDGRLDEAMRVADRSQKSHIAEVVVAGLQEFRSFGSGGSITEEQVEKSKRALERSEAIVHAKLKRRLGGLATIGSTAPFIGLFGTVVGILNAFQQVATQKTSGIGAVAGGISEALITTAFGLLVAIPAVMTFNYFTTKLEAFDIEMDKDSNELLGSLIKDRKVEVKK